MIELYLALAGQAAVEQAAPSAPLKVVNTAFIVANLAAPFQANIRVVIQNTGTEAEELIAVSTPLGETMSFRTDGNLFSNQAPVALPMVLAAPVNGEASYLPLIVRIEGLEQGRYPEGSQITLRFAHAGEMTVSLRQVSPAPLPAR